MSVIARVATVGEMFMSEITQVIHRGGEPMVVEYKKHLISQANILETLKLSSQSRQA